MADLSHDVITHCYKIWTGSTIREDHYFRHFTQNKKASPGKRATAGCVLLLPSYRCLMPPSWGTPCDIKPIYTSLKSTGWPKKVSHKVLSLYLWTIDRFSKFFHWRILWKICNKVITKHTSTPQLRRYTTLWNMKYIKPITIWWIYEQEFGA